MKPKLPDFKTHPAMLALLRDMGLDATKLQEAFSVNIRSVDTSLFQKLETVGVDVTAEQVHVCEDGTLEYAGQKVVVYIRDHRSFAGRPTNSPRFHLSNCKTLKRMKEEGRYEKYVVSRNPTGTFRLIRDRVEVFESLDVCFNCLTFLNYLGFSSLPRSNQMALRSEFQVAEFLKRYDSVIVSMPAHTPETAPLNDYSSDWDTISKRKRESVEWTCEQCGVQLEQNRKYLHVHHRNGLKSDNSWLNLEALCLYCHANEDAHAHMRATPDYQLFSAIRLRLKFKYRPK